MRIEKWIYKLAAALILLGAVYGFSNDQADYVEEGRPERKLPRLVQEALTKKMDNFHQTIIDKCIKDAIKDAEVFVDSLVAEEFKLQGADTLAFPRKPVRPGLPEKIILNDSTRIDPVIPRS